MYADPTIYTPRRASKPTGSPATTGFILALAFLAREPFVICLRRLLGWSGKSAIAHATDGLSLAEIRAAVLGQHEDLITDFLGQPRTRTQGKCPVWYYPLDARQKLAMAITLHEGRAVLVEFLQSPCL